MQAPDLFWEPAVGDLVWFKTGSHGWDCLTEHQRKHPLKVVRRPKRLDSASPLMTWVEPTGPTRTVEVKGGRPRIEKPNWQQPCMVDELIPFEEGKDQ